MHAFEDTDAYIAAQAEGLQERLQLIRNTIRRIAPDAEECISYGMPAFKLHGPLVYFAAFKNHIGFFPTASGISNFTSELQDFRYSKGTIQLPHNKPIPTKLIQKIVRFRVTENQTKAAIRKSRPSAKRKKP